MIPGIDASHFQGAIDWQRVKAAGIQFAYLKATQGASFVDPLLAKNFEGAGAAGIPVGLYHVFIANTGGAQVDNWAKASKQFPAQLPAWLDIEPGAVTEDTAPQALEFLRAEFSLRDCVYCSPSTGDSVLNDERFATFQLAIAHFGVQSPRVPKPWTRWQFWQHSSSGMVDGISTLVDLDWFNGDQDALQGLILPKAT